VGPNNGVMAVASGSHKSYKAIPKTPKPRDNENNLKKNIFY